MRRSLDPWRVNGAVLRFALASSALAADASAQSVSPYGTTRAPAGAPPVGPAPSASPAPALPPSAPGPYDGPPGYGHGPAAPSAQPVGAPPPGEWYGWQVFLVDALGYTVAIVDWDHGGAPGAGLLVLGGPIVHLLHAEKLTAPASLGVRLTFGAMGVAIGGASSEPCEGSGFTGCTFHSAMIGGAIGLGVASIIDGGIFARESPPEPARRYDPRVVPTVQPVRGGVSWGLGGVF